MYHVRPSAAQPEGGYNLDDVGSKDQAVPDDEPHPADASVHWPRKRRDLLEWLRKTSPSLAEIYEGAVVLLFDRQVPGFSRFVSHAVREIRNRLPGVISGTVSAGRLKSVSNGALKPGTHLFD
jgi:hypothetical protein